MEFMECSHCHYREDYWDRLGAVLKVSVLPNGERRYTCPKCIDKLIIDAYIKSSEFEYFNGNYDLSKLITG